MIGLLIFSVLMLTLALLLLTERLPKPTPKPPKRQWTPEQEATLEIYTGIALAVFVGIGWLLLHI